MATAARAGLASGRIMRQKTPSLEQPSIVAASSRSKGRVKTGAAGRRRKAPRKRRHDQGIEHVFPPEDARKQDEGGNQGHLPHHHHGGQHHHEQGVAVFPVQADEEASSPSTARPVRLPKRGADRPIRKHTVFCPRPRRICILLVSMPGPRNVCVSALRCDSAELSTCNVAITKDCVEC